MTMAVLPSQLMSPCPQAAGRGHSVQRQRVWAPVHTLPVSKWWVMDEACPSLHIKIIPSSQRCRPTDGIYLAPGLTSPSKTPAKEAFLLLLAFPRDKGLWAPHPRL